jgi:hypothetical protein
MARVKAFKKKTHQIKAPFEMTSQLSTLEMSVLQGLIRGLSDEEMVGTYGRQLREIEDAYVSLCKRFDILPPRPSERSRLICAAFEYGVLVTEAKT